MVIAAPTEEYPRLHLRVRSERGPVEMRLLVCERVAPKSIVGVMFPGPSRYEKSSFLSFAISPSDATEQQISEMSARGTIVRADLVPEGLRHVGAEFVGVMATPSECIAVEALDDA